MKHCQVTYLLSRLMRDLGTQEREEEALAVHIALNVFQSQAADDKLQMSVKRKPLIEGKKKQKQQGGLIATIHNHV